MLYYDHDHHSTRSGSELLASVETFLELATPETRAPVHAEVSKFGHALPNNRLVREWADGMWLKPGYGTQARVDAVMEKIRQHIVEPGVTFSVRWIPNFVGSQQNSFDILGIDHAMRTEGGNYAHFIALVVTNNLNDASGNAVMLNMVLPFELDSPEHRAFLEHASRKGSFRLAASGFRRLERTQNGGFKRRKI